MPRAALTPRSMKEAFELGGDFHSRTAYGMYDHIKKDVKEGTSKN